MPPSLIDPRAMVSASAVIGEGCTIESGAVVPDGATLGDCTSIGHNAVLLAADSVAPGTAAQVAQRVRVGANAVVYPGLTLGSECLVMPGAVVKRSVPPRAVVEGNPAAIVGYVDAIAPATGIAAQAALAGKTAKVEQLPVRGVTVHQFPLIPDLRGNLTVGEFERQIPFTPQRYFMVFGVPNREVRGEHAHKVCHQFLICTSGACSVVVDDGESRAEVVLDSPSRGLYLPPMVWGIQYKYSPDALLLVFASHHYDSTDYVRDYGEFLRMIERPR